jgi:hypothetical protein
MGSSGELIGWTIDVEVSESENGYEVTESWTYSLGEHTAIRSGTLVAFGEAGSLERRSLVSTPGTGVGRLAQGKARHVFRETATSGRLAYVIVRLDGYCAVWRAR